MKNKVILLILLLAGCNTGIQWSEKDVFVPTKVIEEYSNKLKHPLTTGLSIKNLEVIGIVENVEIMGELKQILAENDQDAIQIPAQLKEDGYLLPKTGYFDVQIEKEGSYSSLIKIFYNLSDEKTITMKFVESPDKE